MPIACCCLMKRKLSDTCLENSEKELLLGLGNIVSYEEIPDAVKTTINRVFPNSNFIRVEWKNTSENGSKSIRSNGWMKETKIPQSSLIINRKDRLQEQYSEYFDEENGDNFGIVVPLISSDANEFQAYLAFSCQEFSHSSKKLLQTFENQVKVMFQRLKRLKDSQNANVQLSNSQNIDLTNHDKYRDSSILSLCAELHDRDPGILQMKIIKFLKQKIQMESSFILTISHNNLELVCQAQDEQIFDPEKRFRVTDSIFEKIIKEKMCAQLSDVDKDKLIELELLTNIKWNSFLCVPIINQSDGAVSALVCMINKLGADSFTAEDIAITRHLFQYTVAVLTSSVAFQMERRLKIQTETMLQVAMNIFRKLGDLTGLLKEIMTEAKKLTSAERCSVFLVDNDTKELVSKVFDGLPTVSEQRQQPVEIRIPVTQGVAGRVAITGEMLNIVDAYSHPLFYRGVDEETGFKTRNILCFPIKDENEKVVGVAQLCNKINGPCFTSYDEDIAKAFSVYCCISIMHSLMYKKVQDAQHRNNLANELMIYHMQVNEDNVKWLTTCEYPTLISIKDDFNNFECIPREIKEMDSVLAVLGMFNTLGFISKWRISRPTLSRFILMIKRGYRDPPYHNWTHAFSVAHFVYLCITNLPLHEQLHPVELLALFVASLCHDIDHRGTNNSFQVTSKSVLAALYSSEGSVLERHHFSQTICVLNSEGCNIFENFSRQDYHRVLDLIRDIILATDLAHHLRIIQDQRKMIDNVYNPNSETHHVLLMDLIMTSADLSDQSKNWKNTRAVAQLIYEEFFSQGDLEKSIGQKPAEQMDRERACVPSLQMSFLDGIALPCFQLFADFYPTCGKNMIENIKNNRSKWEKLNEIIKNGKISANIFQLFHRDISPMRSLSSSIDDS